MLIEYITGSRVIGRTPDYVGKVITSGAIISIYYALRVLWSWVVASPSGCTPIVVWDPSSVPI